ncbi:hypothetical protein VII00023_18909, partial [Vibrio ichthyoenteri ATCC 700023]
GSKYRNYWGLLMLQEAQTKIEIFRSGSIVGSKILKHDELGENTYKISSTRSVNAFPTLSVNSSDAELNKLLLNFSKKDIVRVSILTPCSEVFQVLFEGEFRKKTVSYTKEDNKLSIEFDAIHSFYLLSMMRLSSSFDFSNMTFGDFCERNCTNG